MDAVSIKNIFWKKTWKIPGTPWTIKGYSRSAFRTGFYIPDLSLMLDAGPQAFTKPNIILITHTHVDHIACLPLTLIGDESSTQVFQLYGHHAAHTYVTDYIKSMFAVNSMRGIDGDLPWVSYNDLRAHTTFELEIKKSRLLVAVLECDHAIPTLSFGISETKQKLKQEYIGMPGKEIGALRKTGVQVTEDVIQKRFAYVCDTSIAVFDLNADLLSYPVIFIECTFFMPDELENAVATQHIHWDHLYPYVEKNPDTTFVLFHFSQRYRDQEIRNTLLRCHPFLLLSLDTLVDFFREQPLKNIHCWVSIDEQDDNN